MRAALSSTKFRVMTVVIGLAAASSFALAVQSAWWTLGEVEIGPFGARHCFGGECRESGLAWIGGSELWMRSAVATRAAGYIAMFVLLMFAGALAAKRQPRLAARGALAAIATAAACGAYFIAAFPGLGGAGVAHGVFLYAGAVVAGLVALFMFSRSAARPAPR